MAIPACWDLDWKEVEVLDSNAESMGIDPWILMKAAGEALSDEVEKSNSNGGILFLCGPGNNGGDGFVAALEASKRGLDVSVLASQEKSNSLISEMARKNASRQLDIKIWPSKPDSDFSLVIDCLLGSGSAGPGNSPRGNIREMVLWANSLDAKFIACDIPTGLGSSDEMTTEKTVTFHSKKRGMGKSCGEIIVAPLPWPKEVENCGPGDAKRLPSMRGNARKGDRGRLLILGGGPFHGAPILAGLAAARSGCDLVHVSMPSQAIKRAQWPTTLIPLELPDRDLLTKSSIDYICRFMDSNKTPDSIVLGPGLGNDERTIDSAREIIDLALEREIPIVIDAEATSALPIGSWPGGLVGVATPHSTEAEKWLGPVNPSEALSSCKGEMATIVITGSHDKLTAPEGRKCRAEGGHPRMAVGGSGDLLAGTIGGLMAQGMNPWPASRLGCALLREIAVYDTLS